ncbi:MAG: bifunctional methionine sulfoxide reductase B/A protein [Armatimonadota bacterium]|jgi:peptide methionine sulfoxide reductase msrA/msrB
MDKPNEVRIYDAQTGEVKTLPKVVKTETEWKEILTPEQFRITRLRGTEPPGSGKCDVPSRQQLGIYQCVCCGTDLFKHEHKYESGSGWPSFWEPVSDLNLILEVDESFGMYRTEVMCARCDAHLGHVFDDGPPPTGKRYCINAASLRLSQDEAVNRETAIFAAGCFWGVESAFRELIGKGVISTRVGYTGGHTDHPTYQSVCAGGTAHAEAVEVVFDPNKITYQQLLDLFWSIHDPTTLNRQGLDIGDQYRSAIFYTSAEQKEAAEKSKEQLAQSGKLPRQIVTEITEATEFWEAEEYHQQYKDKRGYGGAR